MIPNFPPSNSSIPLNNTPSTTPLLYTTITNLKETVLSVLQQQLSSSFCSNTSSPTFFTKPLYLFNLLNKLPTNTYYCDYQTSIQVEVKTPQATKSLKGNYCPLEQYDLKPFNQVKAHYYQPSTRQQYGQLVMNCKEYSLEQYFGKRTVQEQQAIMQYMQRMSGGKAGLVEEISVRVDLVEQEQMQCPSPYEPLFYFPGKDGSRLVEFKKKKLYGAQRFVTLECMVIEEWRVKVVNLWGAGQYGVVLEVKKARPLRNVQKLSGQGQKQKQKKVIAQKPTILTDSVRVNQVTSIVYQKQAIALLRDMRARHIKMELNDGDREMFSFGYNEEDQRIEKFDKKFGNKMQEEDPEPAQQFNKNDSPLLDEDSQQQDFNPNINNNKPPNFTYRLMMHNLMMQSGGTGHQPKKRPDDIALDKKGEILSFNQKKPISYIPFGGKMKGFMLFPFPLNSADISHQNIKKLDHISKQRLHQSLNRQNDLRIQLQRKRKQQRKEILSRLKGANQQGMMGLQIGKNNQQQQPHHHHHSKTTQYYFQQEQALHSDSPSWSSQQQQQMQQQNNNQQLQLSYQVENRMKTDLLLNTSKMSDDNQSSNKKKRSFIEMSMQDDDQQNQDSQDDDQHEYYKAYRQQIIKEEKQKKERLMKFNKDKRI